MPQPMKEWTVLPHQKLTLLDEGLLTVVGDLHMPLGDFPRRMTVARLRDGRLVIFSAIALDEAEMRSLDAYGTPAFLVVPNDLHRLDARAWKERYPDLTVVAPAGAKAKVEQVVAVDATGADFGDPRVRLVTVPGTEQHEAALEVETPGGTTLVVNDLIWNVHNRPGFGGWLFSVAGLTGDEPRIPTIVEMRAIKDREALREQLDAWAYLPNLRRIVVSHGEVITDDPANVLRGLASSLA